MTKKIDDIIKAISKNKKVYILFYKHSLSESASDAYAYVMMHELKTNTIVGNTEFFKVDTRNHNVNILYTLDEFDQLPLIIFYENRMLSKKITWTRFKNSRENHYSINNVFSNHTTIS